MPQQNWFERLEDELVKRGVPARFRHRLLAELRDHADDLMDGKEHGMIDSELDRSLGEPATLATEAYEQYRRARWTSRHPLVVFGVMPLPTILLVFVATLLLLWLSAEALELILADDTDQLPRSVLVAFAYTAAWSVRFMPFAIPAVLFTRLYVRSQVNRWWFVAAAAQVLIVAGSMVSLIQFSNEPGQSHWILGFVWAPHPTGDGWCLPLLNTVGWMQVVQVIVPATIAGLMLFGARPVAQPESC